MGNNADIPFNSFTVMQLNIDDEGVSYHVDVQFLITIDHINHPTVGFNAIRHIFLTPYLKRHSIIVILAR